MTVETREKGRDLTYTFVKIPYTNGKLKKVSDNTKMPHKCSTTTQLVTDLGVGLATAMQLVSLTGLRDQPSHSQEQPYNQ